MLQSLLALRVPSWPVCLVLAALPAAAQVALGEKVLDQELVPVMNGDGRTRLSDFVGQPVLIATWMRVEMGNSALERAVKLHEEFGPKGLATILMNLDPGPPTDDEMAAWMLRHGKGTAAITTRAFLYPGLPDGAGEPPYLVLIGVDGTLRASGSAGSTGSALDKLLGEELKKRQGGWGDGVLKKGRALLFGKSDLRGAHELAHDPKAEAQGATVLRQEVETRFTLWKGSVHALIEAGEWQRARRSAADLVKAAGDLPDYSSDVRALEARFATEEAARELALEKKLGDVLAKLEKGRFEQAHVERLRELAEQSPGTPTGKRAERIAAWLTIALAE